MFVYNIYKYMYITLGKQPRLVAQCESTRKAGDLQACSSYEIFKWIFKWTSMLPCLRFRI